MPSRFFGRFLLERDVITLQALLQALSVQDKNNASLGNLAIAHGLLTKEEIQRLHQQQRRVDRKIGEIAVDEGLLNNEQTSALVDEQQRLHLRLGEALVRAGALERKRMETELVAFLKTFLKEEEDTRDKAKPSPAEGELIGRTMRLAQNLLLRLARLQVKVGSAAASNDLPFAVATSVPPMQITLACGERVARAVTCGLLGFEPDNLTREDHEQSLCEFFTALSQQLGGSGLAQPVPLPPEFKKSAQSRELHSPEGVLVVIFVPMP